MANLLAPVGRQRAITDLGVIAPGALLHTYVSGTPNTPLATTADAAGLVPNANPLVASAGGLFGPIYVPAGVAYHFVLTDAAGLPIWDQDPIVAGLGSGDLIVSGLLTVTGFGVHTISAAGTGANQLIVRNTAPGVANLAAVSVGNDADGNLFILQAFSSTYTPLGGALPNGAMLYAAGAGGLSIVSAGGAPVRFYTNGSLERMRIDAAGVVLINAIAMPFSPRLGVVTDLTATNALVLQNSNASNTGLFLAFANSAAAVAGSINHTGATSVVYATSSDARLKTDAGRASDLAALRALVVHDFTWTADGRRDRGIFAQEAHALYPRAIVPGTDDRTDAGHLARPWMTDYSKFVPDLIAGWQAHEAELTALRAALAAMGQAR